MAECVPAIEHRPGPTLPTLVFRAAFAASLPAWWLASQAGVDNAAALALDAWAAWLGPLLVREVALAVRRSGRNAA